MFLKVYKYDFLAVFGRMKYFYLITFAAALLSVVCSYLPVKYYYDTFQSSYVILSVLCLIVPFFLVMYRYYKSMLSDEGYLTHCLPVKKSVLILSTYLNAFVYHLISLVFLLFCSMMISANFWQEMVSFVQTLGELFQLILTETMAIRYLILCLLLILSFSFFVLSGVTMCLSLGARHNQKKGLMTFIYLLVIYLIIQFLIGTFSSVYFLMVPMSTAEQVDLAITLYLAIGLVGFSVFSLICYFINYLMVSKYLNLS